MSYEHDQFTHVLEAWLDTSDAPEDPAAVASRVIARLEVVPQGRWSWPLPGRARGEGISRIAVIGATFVAVVAVATALAVNREWNVGGLGPQFPTPSSTFDVSPSPAASPSRSPRPAVNPRAWGDGGLIAHERMLVTSGLRGGGDPVFSFAVPTSMWAGDQFVRILRRDDAGADLVLFYIGLWDPPDNLYADPCARTLLQPAVGSSPAELAAGLAALPGARVLEGPSHTVVDGHPATFVEIDFPSGDDCPSEPYYLWWEDSGGVPLPQRGGSTRVWIVDVAGHIFWYLADIRPGANEDVMAELEQVVESIRFED